MIFVIDTARDVFWDRLPDLDICYVCEDPNRENWNFGIDDIVFAHSHEVAIEQNSDLVIGSFKSNWPVVQRFCRACVAASSEGSGPTFILYSGGGCREHWKELSASVGGALSGYSPERIYCHLNVIPRQNCVDELRNMVATVSGGIARSAGEAMRFDPSWLEDAKLAATLLIDAVKMESGTCGSASIVAPPEDLVSLAREVIDASSKGIDIAPAAGALCEGLKLFGAPQS